MIVTKIYGGLGNQMFQYAAARSLSLRNGSSLAVDLQDVWRVTTPHNGYELSRVFDLSPANATQQQLKRLIGAQRFRIVRRILKDRIPNPQYIREPHFHHWPKFHEISGDAYLDGYWQSHLYFSDYEEIIRRDFNFRAPLEGQNLLVAKSIAASEASVSVHVRRGDYVSNSTIAAFHGTTNIAYYQSAADAMAKKIGGNISFFVFSDDISWTKQNLSLPGPTTYVDGNQAERSQFDMHLMSICHHNIIANSSFSWWAAWLNKNPFKSVIAPSKWFQSADDTADLIPSKWVRL